MSNRCGLTKDERTNHILNVSDFYFYVKGSNGGFMINGNLADQNNTHSTCEEGSLGVRVT